MKPKNNDPKSFYTEHGPYTSPGSYAHLYTSLPCDLDALCGIVNGLIVHDLWLGMGLLEIPAERKDEAEIRSTQSKLGRIMEMDARPLAEARPFQERLFGNCRDQALLLCSFLRTCGIPARVRKGFMTNAGPHNLDHAICQVWSETDGRLLIVDVQMDNILRESDRLPPDARQYPKTITPQDTPPENFLTGGQVWKQCRSGAADPLSFGIDGDYWGLQMIRHNLLRDLLALNKFELIPWDDIADSLLTRDVFDITPEQFAFLDHVAEVTIGVDTEFDEILRLYEETPSIHVPADWVNT